MLCLLKSEWMCPNIYNEQGRGREEVCNKELKMAPVALETKACKYLWVIASNQITLLPWAGGGWIGNPSQLLLGGHDMPSAGSCLPGWPWLGKYQAGSKETASMGTSLWWWKRTPCCCMVVPLPVLQKSQLLRQQNPHKDDGSGVSTVFKEVIKEGGDEFNKTNGGGKVRILGWESRGDCMIELYHWSGNSGSFSFFLIV